MKDFEGVDNIIWSDPTYGAPIVKISDYGIVFNGATIELLGEPEGIKMGYDIENNNLLILPVSEYDNNQANIYEFAGRKKDKGHSIRIGNKRFIKYISSKLGKDLTKSTNKFPANWVDEKNILLVDLDMPMDDIKDKEKNKVKKIEKENNEQK